MKVKLLVDLPIGLEHGMTKGRILEMTDWVVPSDAGIGVGLLPHEFMEVQATPKDSRDDSDDDY